jgi:hypothetical protein
VLTRRQPDNQNRQANRLVNGLVQSSWLHCERETTELDLAGKLLPVRDARGHSHKEEELRLLLCNTATMLLAVRRRFQSIRIAVPRSAGNRSSRGGGAEIRPSQGQDRADENVDSNRIGGVIFYEQPSCDQAAWRPIRRRHHHRVRHSTSSISTQQRASDSMRAASAMSRASWRLTSPN